MNVLIALLAIIFDLVVVYPSLLQHRIGHPVQWMGLFIDRVDERFNEPEKGAIYQRRAGMLMLAGLCAATLVAALVITIPLRLLPFGWVIEALIASVFLAQRQLASAVRSVAYGLEGSLNRGREAVGEIVGRDTSHLDEAGVSRAAIETLAENASDGVYAPLFFLLLFGLPGIAVYKAINTADSMVGHLDDRYRDFGWASARADDIVNWIPARLTALLFAFAAIFFPHASPPHALQAAFRDGPKHASPNAGWPEAAMAGALNFGLGGPRSYDGRTVALPHMGDGRRFLSPADIRKALRFYSATGVVTAILLAGGVFVAM